MACIRTAWLLFNLMGGLGLFFTGVGVLWFASIYKNKSDQ